MRRLILALPLLAVAAPAAAQDTEEGLDRMARAMGDPVRQEALARAMGAMAGMSGALAGMLPQLREAAERMRDALPTADLAERP